jgi:hypothetical protein
MAAAAPGAPRTRRPRAPLRPLPRRPAQAAAVAAALPAAHAARAAELEPEAASLRRAAALAPLSWPAAAPPPPPPAAADAGLPWYCRAVPRGDLDLDSLEDLELGAYTGGVIWALAAWAAGAAAGALARWRGPPGLPFGLGDGAPAACEPRAVPAARLGSSQAVAAAPAAA